MNRIAPCLLLLCVSAMAGAHEVRMHGPNGDGGCSDAKATPATLATPPAKPAGATHAKAKTAPVFRAGGDDDNSPHMPRWHSFLPGMFR
jgi:hypothetical protein